MSTYKISKARLGDIPTLKAIEVKCGLSPWSITAYEAELVHPDSVMLTARSADDFIVGFLVGRVASGGEAAILNIGATPEFRRRGIGSELIKAFIAVCVGRGATGIWLEVRPSNVAAIEFYKSHGFVRKGTRPHFYTDPPENADLMYAALIATDRQN